MPNNIFTTMQRLRYITQISSRFQSLPAIPPQELGKVKDQDDFVLRAADLALGCEADQFEDLLEGLSLFCRDIGEDCGDPAYIAAAAYLGKAQQAVRSRLGN